MEKQFDRPKLTSYYLSTLKGESPVKRKLRKDLAQTEKQNKELKKQCKENVLNIEKIDSKLIEVTDDYEEALVVLGQIENSYGKLVAKLAENNTEVDQQMKNDLKILVFIKN